MIVHYVLATDEPERVTKALAETPPKVYKTMITAKEAWLKEGREEGREEGHRMLVEHMLGKGLTFKEIADLTGLKVATVRALAKKIGREEAER